MNSDVLQPRRIQAGFCILDSGGAALLWILLYRTKLWLSRRGGAVFVDSNHFSFPTNSDALLEVLHVQKVQ